MPISIYLFEIWGEWKLSVSWTRDTYVDGELVKHEEGGWTESWRELIARGEQINYVEVYERPLWEQLGFNTAVSGAKSLGTVFPISPEMLTIEPWYLYVHVTDPKKDPVITVPYKFELSIDPKGNVVATHVDPATAEEKDPCEKLRNQPIGGTIAGPGTASEGAGTRIFHPQDENSATPIELDLEGTKVTVDPNQETKTQEPTSSLDEANSETTPPDETGLSDELKKKLEKIHKGDFSDLTQEDLELLKKHPEYHPGSRALTPDEVKALKTKPSENDVDGDGIANEFDTMPNTPSNMYVDFKNSTVATIKKTGGNKVIIDNSSVEVIGESGGEPAIIEVLGVGLEVEPGTIFEFDFG